MADLAKKTQEIQQDRRARNLDSWFQAEVDRVESLLRDLKRYQQRWQEERTPEVVEWATVSLVRYSPNDATVGVRHATMYQAVKELSEAEAVAGLEV